MVYIKPDQRITMKLLTTLLCSLLLLVNHNVLAEEKENHTLFKDNLTITLPSELKQLSKSGLKKHYGQQKVKPSAAFNNKDQTVSFTFTQYSTPADKASMNKIHKSLSNMLRKSSGKASWKKDKVYTRLGTKIAVYEYEVAGIGKYQYNLTYVLPVDGKLTFISFICTEKKYKTKWLEQARESLDSLKLAS